MNIGKIYMIYTSNYRYNPIFVEICMVTTHRSFSSYHPCRICVYYNSNECPNGANIRCIKIYNKISNSNISYTSDIGGIYYRRVLESLFLDSYRKVWNT